VLGDGHDAGWGGVGNDYIYAGSGNDFLFGGAGYDVLLGEAGNDWLDGASAQGTADYLFGGIGADKSWFITFREQPSSQILIVPKETTYDFRTRV
jgi:Ca2+-binding RTX toxin-like protein